MSLYAVNLGVCVYIIYSTTTTMEINYLNKPTHQTTTTTMSLIRTPSAADHHSGQLSQSMEEGPPPDTEQEQDNEPEEDFSFVCLNPDDGSAPVFPLFNRDLLFSDDGDALRPPLRKVFVEEEMTTTAPAGPYCEWTASRTAVVAESSPGPSSCKKSNSTGFSKLWRLRPEPKLRSKSDGKDAFVFLSDHQSSKDKERGRRKSEEERHPPPAPASKHKSYLPYRHVGLFADVNSLTRNIHPF